MNSWVRISVHVRDIDIHVVPLGARNLLSSAGYDSLIVSPRNSIDRTRISWTLADTLGGSSAVSIDRVFNTEYCNSYLGLEWCLNSCLHIYYLTCSSSYYFLLYSSIFFHWSMTWAVHIIPYLGTFIESRSQNRLLQDQTLAMPSAFQPAWDGPGLSWPKYLASQSQSQLVLQISNTFLS